MSEGSAAGRVNRRLTARKTCVLTVRYRMKKDWHPATAINLSTSGCRLRLGESLPHGAALTVIFERPLADGATGVAAEAQGTVTWSRLEGLSYTAGIRFTDAPLPALDDLLVAIG